MTEIWIEKYRPKSFNDIKGQIHIVDKIKAMVNKKALPHLLFAGPAGVGKTSLILVIAKELYKENWKENILELNASDSRGIDVIRNEVKNFARTRSLGEIPFKICILDEADSLTKEAQQALRRTMEMYSQTCRFCLLCNYSSKIIDPIQSRCAIFRFRPLIKDDLKNIIDNVSEKENLSIDKEAKELLIEVSEGDVRRLQNILQSSASISDVIDTNAVLTIVSAAKPEELRKVLNMAVNGDFISSKENLLKLMLESGLSGIDIIKQIQKEIWNLDIENDKKLGLIEKCGEIEFRMVEGSDEFVQLEALLSYFSLVGK